MMARLGKEGRVTVDMEFLNRKDWVVGLSYLPEKSKQYLFRQRLFVEL